MSLCLSWLNVQMSKQYLGVTKTSKGRLSPHIFAIAGASYQGMIREFKDQVSIDVNIDTSLILTPSKFLIH